MTVREFAEAAFEPVSMEVSMCGATYNLINDYDGHLDKLMVGLFGDYVVNDFTSNKPMEYTVFVKEVPVKATVKEATT